MIAVSLAICILLITLVIIICTFSFNDGLQNNKVGSISSNIFLIILIAISACILSTLLSISQVKL